MQVDTNVSEADIGGIAEGKAATFTVDAYPGNRFHGRVRQVRNAPINVQNVVDHDVVVEFDNPDFRLKPGMTANVSIGHREARAGSESAELGATSSRLQGGLAKSRGRLWGWARTDQWFVRVGFSAMGSLEGGGQNDLSECPWEMGISDRSYVEVTAEGLREGTTVVVGIDNPAANVRERTSRFGSAGSSAVGGVIGGP